MIILLLGCALKASTLPRVHLSTCPTSLLSPLSNLLSPALQAKDTQIWLSLRRNNMVYNYIDIIIVDYKFHGCALIASVVQE